MAIEKIHSFLIQPGKKLEEQPEIKGTEIEHKGKLFDMLKETYDKSEKDCKIEIAFEPTSDGEQQNDCRDLVLNYLKQQSRENAALIAGRLQSVTNRQSGLALLFLIVGSQTKNKKQETKIVISRFPADNGILADIDRQELTVSFIEKVFMKNASAYKSALYSGELSDSGFWEGKAVDKQINSNMVSISNYWVRDFLMSDFRTTSAAGTRRLAIALRDIVSKSSDLQIKEEIAASARLASGLNRKVISPRLYCEKFSLSEKTQESVRTAMKTDYLYTERFPFSAEEFSIHIAFQSIELDNGAILTAESQKFDTVFKRESVEQSVRFTTQGLIVNQKLRKAKL